MPVSALCTIFIGVTQWAAVYSIIHREGRADMAHCTNVG